MGLTPETKRGNEEKNKRHGHHRGVTTYSNTHTQRKTEKINSKRVSLLVDTSVYFFLDFFGGVFYTGVVVFSWWLLEKKAKEIEINTTTVQPVSLLVLPSSSDSRRLSRIRKRRNQPTAIFFFCLFRFEKQQQQKMNNEKIWNKEGGRKREISFSPRIRFSTLLIGRNVVGEKRSRWRREKTERR